MLPLNWTIIHLFTCHSFLIKFNWNKHSLWTLSPLLNVFLYFFSTTGLLQPDLKSATWNFPSPVPSLLLLLHNWAVPPIVCVCILLPSLLRVQLKCLLSTARLSTPHHTRELPMGTERALSVVKITTGFQSIYPYQCATSTTVDTNKDTNRDTNGGRAQNRKWKKIEIMLLYYCVYYVPLEKFITSIICFWLVNRYDCAIKCYNNRSVRCCCCLLLSYPSRTTNSAKLNRHQGSKIVFVDTMVLIAFYDRKKREQSVYVWVDDNDNDSGTTDEKKYPVLFITFIFNLSSTPSVPILHQV